MQASLSVIAFSVAATVGSAPSISQTVSAPSVSVGDSWTLRTTDQWSGKVRHETTTTVIGVMNEFVRMSTEGITFSANGTSTSLPPFDLTTRANLDVVHNVNGSSTTRILFAWPLRIGKQWTYEFTTAGETAANTPPITFKMAAEAVAWEEVPTAVGKFKAIKVVHAGTMGPSGTNSNIAKITQTLWYVPEVKYYVRSQTEIVGADGSPGMRQLSELTAIKLR